jgi:predicted alpha/beta superfamily hydrolase
MIRKKYFTIMTINKTLAAGLTILLLLTMLSIRAQQTNITKEDSLYSHVLNEQRKMHVVFPLDYDSTKTAQYEVVYCLDDIAEFLVTEWNFLQGEGFIPKNMIMVGITNANKNGADMRERDFSPTKTWDNTGGASNFLSFIKKELIPYVQEKYKGATDGNTLYGGSLAGLFVMYTLLAEPTLFTSYIAIEPSLWWDNFWLNKTAEEKIAAMKDACNTLFLAVREGAARRYMGVGTWKKKLFICRQRARSSAHSNYLQLNRHMQNE